MKLKLILPVLLTSIFLISCNTNPTVTVEIQPYFNLKGFFENESIRLQNENKILTKTIFKDNKEETMVVNTIDWKTELQSFIDIDINKPALLSAYKTDSVVRGARTEIHYAAKDSTPQIRDIVLKLTNHIPDTIIVTRIMSNSYVSSTEELHYFGNGNYEIVVDNTPVAGKKIAFRLIGRTQNKDN